MTPDRRRRDRRSVINASISSSAKFVLPTDVLAARNDDKENVSLIKSIHTIFLDTMKTLDYFPARFECRVDIKDIDHLELDVETAKQWMMSVQAKIWW